MKIFKEFDKKVKQPFCGYVLGLILGTKKRTCTHMAHVSKMGHDVLYRLLSKTSQLIPIMPQLMVSVVNHFAKTKPGHLIIDDTFMSKVFSKLLAGVYIM